MGAGTSAVILPARGELPKKDDMKNISVSQMVDGETIVWINDQQYILTAREADLLVAAITAAKRSAEMEGMLGD